jgi:SAM-dependent methyltransferase
MKTDDQIRTEVRTHYSAVARGEARTGCCAPIDAGAAARTLGYSADEVAAAPAGANLGLGCGNPQAIAALRPGEVVVDLGSGAGFDCFLAARAVGPDGRVIGVDGSADMIALARSNATKHAAAHVEFRLGEIEKRAVYADVLRVLRPGGRVAISDVVALRELPSAVANDLAAHCGCIAGAAPVAELSALLADLGFIDVRIELEPQSREIIGEAARPADRDDEVARAARPRPATRAPRAVLRDRRRCARPRRRRAAAHALLRYARCMRRCGIRTIRRSARFPA